MRWGELSPFHDRTVGTPVTLEGHPGAENSAGRPHGQANCARVQFFRNFLQNPIGEECFLIRSLDRAVADTARNRREERSQPELAAEFAFCAQADRPGPSLPGLEPGPYFAVIAANSRIAKFAGFRPCPWRVRSGIGSDMPTSRGSGHSYVHGESLRRHILILRVRYLHRFIKEGDRVVIQELAKLA